MTQQLTVTWDECSQAQWADYLARISKSNLIQTWPYAQAVRAAQQRATRFGLIRVSGVPVGICQIQEQRLLGFHYVALHRGPLWFDDANDPGLPAAFLAEFAREFPRRPGRIRRLLPELENSPEAAAMLGASGFRRQGAGYQTLWVDLCPDPALLRAGMAQKWRNRLNAAERSDLRCTEVAETTGTAGAPAVEWLIARYMADRKTKRYRGPSASMVRALVQFFGVRNDTLLLRAVERGKPVAAVLIFVHGRSATYQIGWSDARGRSLSATNLLLWQAMLRLRERGVEWLDTGGIHPDAAPGLTHFKRGLGGIAYETVGACR